jgi:hypothetical protein
MSHISVKTDFRRKSISRQIMTECFDNARVNNVMHISLNTDIENLQRTSFMKVLASTGKVLFRIFITILLQSIFKELEITHADSFEDLIKKIKRKSGFDFFIYQYSRRKQYKNG